MSNTNIFTDTHAHIFLDDFDRDREDIIRKAEASGVVKIYMPNLDSSSIDAMMEVELRHPNCHAMMGLHPTYVKKGFERELYIVEEWFSKRAFAAVGEVGTDLYWDTSTFAYQAEAFKVQMGIAEKYNRPLVIHCRNSFRETVDLIESSGRKAKGVFHCFSGTEEDAKTAVSLGFFLGIGGNITFKNSGMDKIMETVSLEHIVLETDSPYLTPAPHRKHRNDPSYIPVIAERLSEIKCVAMEEVSRITTENAVKLFA